MTLPLDYKNLNDALYPLNECDNPDVDIVFFHGVAREEYKLLYKETWMTTAALLPGEPELSKARMFSVKYDSSAKKAPDRGRFEMRTLVENLAANLLELNSENIGQQGIPVILVGHDLGGLVIKELCLYLNEEISLGKSKGTHGTYSSTVYENFLDSLAGIFYFATPHQGLQLVADGMQLDVADGDLLRNLKISNADIAKSNNDFRKLRQRRKWMARGVGPAFKDKKEFLQIEEASMRYDTDRFVMVLESIWSITKPKSRESSSFQFFAQSMEEFIKAFRDRGLGTEDGKNDPLRGTVGLEGVLEQIMGDLSRQQEANAGTSAVVLHGMGGIGKSTLGLALYRTLRDRPRRRVFYSNSRCHLDRQITGGNPTSVTQLQLNLLNILDRYNISAVDASSHGNLRDLLMTCYEKKKLMGMPLLIFLDNTEDDNELKDLLPGHIGACLPRGSHLIVATRNSMLFSTLRSMDLPNAMLYKVKVLDAFTSQRLLCRHAFGNGEVEIPLSRVPVPWTDVEKVAEACGGLPLALEVVGAYLRFDEAPPDSPQDRRKKWRKATNFLKKSVKGNLEKESRLQRCLEFSYDKLSEKLQRSFLDIVLCFNGSPSRELRSMYDHELDILKRRALIKEGTAIATGQRIYQYVKVHSLLACLCREKGKKSHFFKSIDGSHVNFDDIPTHQLMTTVGSWARTEQDNVALVLEGRRLSLVKTYLTAYESTLLNWILPFFASIRSLLNWIQIFGSKSTLVIRIIWGISTITRTFLSYLRCVCKVIALCLDPHGATHSLVDRIVQFFIPDQQAVQSLPISHLMRASPSLRILILKDLRVIGTFADDNLPLHLKCLVCSNSTVPFTSGNLTNLRKLKFVDFSNTIQNRAFKFGKKVKRLRLESPIVETLRFEEDGDCDLEELGLVSARSFQAYSPNSKFPKLRKLIIQDVPRLKELPRVVYTMQALESLSVHGCDQLTELAVDLCYLRNLRHFHISLENLRRLPDTLCSSTSLQTLSLENCFSLDQLPNDIGCIPTLEALGIKGCLKLASTYLPGSLRTAFQITSRKRFELGEGNSVPRGEISMTTDHSTVFNVERNEWLVCIRKNSEDIAKLIEDAATAAQMLSVMLRPIVVEGPPNVEKFSDSLYDFGSCDGGKGNVVVIFFQRLELNDRVDAKDTYLKTWTFEDNPQKYSPSTMF